MQKIVTLILVVLMCGCSSGHKESLKNKSIELTGSKPIELTENQLKQKSIVTGSGEKFETISNDFTKGIVFFNDEANKKSMVAILCRIAKNNVFTDDISIILLEKNSAKYVEIKRINFKSVENTIQRVTLIYNVEKMRLYFGFANSEPTYEIFWNGKEYILHGL
jgi:uncharacterized protein YcfL